MEDDNTSDDTTDDGNGDTSDDTINDENGEIPDDTINDGNRDTSNALIYMICATISLFVVLGISLRKKIFR